VRGILAIILLGGMSASVAIATGQTITSNPASNASAVAAATGTSTAVQGSKPEVPAQALPSAPTARKSGPDQGAFGLHQPAWAPTGTQFPHVGTCCNPGAGPVTGGALFQKIFGRSLSDRGYYVENFLQIGLAENTASDPTGRAWGGSNYPVVGVPDQGFVFNSLSLMTHKDVTTDIMPRGGPVKGAIPTKWSWGWFTEWTYGRNSQAARMSGWEMNWGINQPGAGSSAQAAENKQPFFAMQHDLLEVYSPLLKGVDVLIGRFAPAIGYEMPPSYRPGPDYFYSRVYEIPATPVDVLGMLSAWNLMRSDRYGYLAAEFGLNTGYITVVPQSGRPNYQMSLRYRTPNMRTKIDYESQVGCQEIEPGAEQRGALPAYRVVSPNCLVRQIDSLNGSQTFGARSQWNFAGDIYYGKMNGDHNPGTVTLMPFGGNPAGSPFYGAFYQGEYGQLVYRETKTLSYGARFEHFRNPDGFGIVPVSTVKSNFNALTVGPHYDVSNYITLRPEVRYDFQTNNHGVNAFGLDNQVVNGVVQHTEDHQVTYQMDMLFNF